ncbi:hypothetical protein T439DRAFT_320726 [Meredithblackwellia eburnea MCA 4105]
MILSAGDSSTRDGSGIGQDVELKTSITSLPLELLAVIKAHLLDHLSNPVDAQSERHRLVRTSKLFHQVFHNPGSYAVSNVNISDRLWRAIISSESDILLFADKKPSPPPAMPNPVELFVELTGSGTNLSKRFTTLFKMCCHTTLRHLTFMNGHKPLGNSAEDTLGKALREILPYMTKIETFSLLLHPLFDPAIFVHPDHLFAFTSAWPSLRSMLVEPFITEVSFKNPTPQHVKSSAKLAKAYEGGRGSETAFANLKELTLRLSSGEDCNEFFKIVLNNARETLRSLTLIGSYQYKTRISALNDILPIILPIAPRLTHFSCCADDSILPLLPRFSSLVSFVAWSPTFSHKLEGFLDVLEQMPTLRKLTVVEYLNTPPFLHSETAGRLAIGEDTLLCLVERTTSIQNLVFGRKVEEGPWPWMDVMKIPRAGEEFEQVAKAAANHGITFSILVERKKIKCRP